MNTYRTFVAVALVLVVAVSSQADPPAWFSQSSQEANALNYLKSIQNADGSWGGTPTSLNSTFPTTTTSLEALRELETTPSANQTSAIQFLSSQTVDENAFLAARIIALAGTSSDTTADRNTLLSRQNQDGGWGTTEGLESDPPDTSLALLALRSANVTDATVTGRALNYLIRTQNLDGGWPLTTGDASQIFYTGLALQALNSFRLQFDLSFNQGRGIVFLRSQQNLGDGGYGLPSSTAFETALSLLAILGSGQTLTPAEASAVNFLTHSQQSNGSWSDDAYSTALALRALAFPRDTDADGMSDGFEAANGLNPNDPADAAGDNDSDGLTNLQEFRQGTNLSNPDTDGDGVDDQTELFSGSDPRDPNSHNRPPQITSHPLTAASEGLTYSYQVQGADPDNDPLAFSLLHSAAGMSISQTGLVEWTPTSNQAGSFTVIVRASDGRGGHAFQQYRVTVLAQGIDLAAASVDASAVTTDVQTLIIGGSVRVNIQNRGGSLFSGQFAVLLFEDRNNNGTYQTGVDNPLGTETFSGSIDSNASDPLDVRVSGVVQFRDGPIHAFVDSAAQIPELDETNNIGTSATESKYHPPVGEFQPKVKWEYASTQAGVYSTPVVAPLIDTNGDLLVNERDIPAVIVVDYDFSGLPARLVALRGDTGAIIFSTAASLAAHRNAAVGDINCDGIPEVVVPGDDGRVRCFNNNGTLRWTSPSIIHNGTITLADLDGDCRSEILSGSGLVNHDGTLRWDNFSRLPGYLGGISESRGRQVADLDLDGRPEIISGPSALDRNGNAIWYWRSFSDGAGGWVTTGTLDRGATTLSVPTNFNLSDGYTAVANMDDDPEPEVVVVNDSGSGDDVVMIFGPTGRIESQFIVYQQPSTLGPPTVADFDGDGHVDIAIPGKRMPNVDTQADPRRAMMAVYRRDGSLIWRRDLITSTMPSNGIYPASAFDFDGDGAAELVYTDTQRLYLLNGGDGSSLFEMGVNRSQSGEAVSYAVIADAPNTGGANIIVPTNQSAVMSGPARKGVLVLSDTKDNWLNARRVWNQWMYHVTNVGEDGRIPPVAANNWQGLNTHRTQSSIDGLDRFAAPDLTVSKVTTALQNCPANLGITARVGNGGSLHSPAGVTVSFYSGDPEAGGMLIGTRQTSRALYPGDFEDVTLTGITPPGGPVFVEVNVLPIGNPTPSANLSRLPHSWAQASGHIVGSFVPVNQGAYFGINGTSGAWSENFVGGGVSTGPSFYEVRFPYPVNATSVTVENAGTNNTGFLAGTLTFSNGFSTPAVLNANGEGTTSFLEQQNVTWIRLTASSLSSIKSGGASVSEFIVGGSYVDPPFRLNEGDGRLGNNRASSAPGIAPCDTTTNQPPVINSAPPITASTGVAYAYQVQASDPNNDSLSFSLITAPTGMLMNGSGLIWTPADTQTGDFLVTVQVSDGRGGSADQTFTIGVGAPSGLNGTPTITSTPATSIVLGQAYQYAVSATDPNGDTVLFALLQAPAGAVIDQFGGLVSWTASASQIGSQFFTLEAQDGRGGRVVQSFTVDVQPSISPLPPQPADRDLDGFDENEDCDDANPNINSGGTELPGNGSDDDCNPATPDTVPANSLACTIVTDKRSYEANGLAQLTVTTRNVSANLSLTGLVAHITVSDPGGQSVYTNTAPVNSLSPNGLFRATAGFNTETSPPGTYQTNLELRFGSAVVCGSQASFAILSSAAQGNALAGNITVDPAQIVQLDSTFSYQISNVGNVDLPALNVKILTVELPGGAVVRTLAEQTSLNKGQAFNNSQTFSVNGLRAGDYLAILQGESGGTTQTINSASFTIVNQPPVARCKDVTKTADRNVTPQEVDAGSTDPEGNPLTLSLDPAGPYPLGTTAVTLTVADDKGSSSQCTANVTINRGTSAISWNNPADIGYGTPLGAGQLNATASFNGTEVPGTFNYTPAAGTVLSAANGQTLSVSFSPTDTTLYTEATSTVAINVVKATATLSVTGGSFTYDGQPHPAAGSVVGISGEDLGTPTLTYNGSPDLPVNAGHYGVSASFAGNANYNAASGSASIVINEAPATISLSNLTQAYDGSPKSATATTSPAGLSGLSITHDGSTTPPTNPGSYTLTASLNNPNYDAPNVTATLVITQPMSPTNIAYTGSTMMAAGELTVLSAVLTDSSASTLTPVVNKNLTLTLGSGANAQSCTADTDSNGSARCTISAVNQPLGAGTVSASFGGDSHYLPSSINATTWVFAGEACFVLDFREITYFRNTHVLTSSDAEIRTRNGFAGGFDPSRWPYAPQGGSHKTRSRATLFRVYGFSANQVGVVIPNADNPNITYTVRADTEISGAYYIDLGGPARVVICPSQLQTHLIGAGEQVRPWSLSGTSPLTDAQKNVPGIMLTHNVAKIAIPERVRDELRSLGMPLVDAQGRDLPSGLVDYIGFQLWGHGNAEYREFVDVNIKYIFDDAADRLKHYKFGFHTAKNGDLETFVGCRYLDHAPGNDGVRFNDVWAGRHQNNPQWGPACGSLEPSQNQKVRENYAVPLDGIQILPTVNSHDDTLRILFGRIRAQE